MFISDRQYLSEPQLKAILPSYKIKPGTESKVSEAEAMIDSYISNFYQGAFRKVNIESYVIKSSDVSAVTNTSITLSGKFSRASNFYQYLVVEFLNGALKGLITPVVSSSGSILTIRNTPEIETADLKIYQLGKAPFYYDWGLYAIKTIPNEISRATAYQLEFLDTNKKKVKSKGKKSESIGTSYSYTAGGASENSIQNRIAPQAIDLLAKYRVQTI